MKMRAFLLSMAISWFFPVSLVAVMAPWYWVGFPIQLNPEYPGNQSPAIGVHHTFIFDTYHYEGTKKYPAGRIMQNNTQIFNWYVALIPQSKGHIYKDNNDIIAFMEATPWVIQMLHLPRNTESIALVVLGTKDSWSEIWMSDRQQLRRETYKTPRFSLGLPSKTRLK